MAVPESGPLTRPLETDQGIVWLGLCAVPKRLRDLSRFVGSLSEEERDVAASIAFAPKAAEYLVSRSLARDVAGRVLQLDPRDVPLHAPRGSAPSISSDASLSLSHSNGMVAVAVSTSMRVAVDIESEGAHLIGLCGRFVPQAEAVTSTADASRRWVIWEAQRKLGEAARVELCLRIKMKDERAFAVGVVGAEGTAVHPDGAGLGR